MEAFNKPFLKKERHHPFVVCRHCHLWFQRISQKLIFLVSEDFLFGLWSQCDLQQRADGKPPLFNTCGAHLGNKGILCKNDRLWNWRGVIRYGVLGNTITVSTGREDRSVLNSSQGLSSSSQLEFTTIACNCSSFSFSERFTRSCIILQISLRS